MNKVPTKERYHRTDGWRGYSIPALAVAGSSDTGTWEDSPCPSDAVTHELAALKHFLKEHGIDATDAVGETSNVFCGKRWVVVKREDFAKAATLTQEYLAARHNDTQYIHSADLDELGYKGGAHNNG